MLVAMLRLLVIVVALAACRDDELERVRAVRNEVCACKTSACGEEAMKKLPSSAGTGNAKPSQRQTALANEMLTFMAKLYLKDRPTTDPDAPKPAQQ
jgi:hypothetical protein